MDFLVCLFCTVLRYDNKTIISALFRKNTTVSLFIYCSIVTSGV